ncbi:aminoacyl--tRNA ligase-related protein [Pendulispora albinea]|uniref:Aminoacyl-tRNA synthetase class II (G/ P/ S/T) domain-containing protein n=1 Tax=Pendulispora albinea TaxID=2741071 RepID=A0ABZ2LWH3_9BACT
MLNPTMPAALRGPLALLADRIDRLFVELARSFDAEPWVFPPFVNVSDLRRIDYFTSFPHLILLPVSPEPSDEAIEAFRKANGAEASGPVELTSAAPIELALAPAACYSFYPAMRGCELETPYVGTTLGTCFRRERSYHGLERRASFRMREMVHVGSAATVGEFLETARERVEKLSARWGIPLHFETATDPFFDPRRSSRYAHQKLFPTKKEMIHRELALGSLNRHRNFFGEAFDLRFRGEAAHTACVAFGIERWASTIVAVHGDDPAGWPCGLEKDQP